MKTQSCIASFVKGFPAIALVAFCLTSFNVSAQSQGRTLVPDMRHLGDSPVKDWPGVSEKPDGPSLQLEFNASANQQPATLKVRQRDVDNVWRLKINDREIAVLPRRADVADRHYELPAGTLRNGANQLEISSANKTDDIAVGQIVLHEAPVREVLKLRALDVRVTDATGKPLPARVAIEAADGSRPEMFHSSTENVAIRDGLIYVSGAARFEIPAGNYRVSATRGMEWSRPEKEVNLSSDTSIELQLKREVDTTGFVAADTHIHTYTFSGHGDATAEERVLSLAGEGVELAIATDHNHNTDYRPYQDKLALNDYFTPVAGNEVTTANGHFNGFPLKPGEGIPPYLQTNWVKVVEGIRLKGAKVVILNHPRWPTITNSPFSILGLNRANGVRASGMEFTFDAMELVNSYVNPSDPTYVLKDWFALLNAGEKIWVVGSSDSHTIGEAVGQGRTYIPSSTDDASALNVDELCENILKGRSSVSWGIFSRIKVDDQYTSGDLVPVKDGQVSVEVNVAAPSWIRPRKATIYLNGEAKAEQDVPTQDGQPTNARLTFKVPAHGVDAHLVCVVLGDGVKHAGWKTLHDYTLAASNPVFLDVNNDGSYASPRDSAKRILTGVGGDVDAMINTLEVVPPPVGVQMLALGRHQFTGLDAVLLNRGIDRLAELEPLFALYKEGYEAAKAK